MAIRVITRLTDTVRVQYSRLAEAFVPRWDAQCCSEQAMSRVKVRAQMGQKRTPRRGGRLRPARR
jgi:hypothetical protein